ncbi:MAG: RNA polymerase sigma factor [Phycisphaerae bacterium]|nr:RNA polymerase sigma factor [Phycisphaerae bacterium]
MAVSVIATRCGEAQRDAEDGVLGRARRSSSGDKALEMLASDFEELHALVYRYLLHRFFDRELAEELTAQTFYKAAVCTSRLKDDIRQVRVWLLRAATNLANTHYRRNRLRQFVLRQLAGVSAKATESPTASDSTDARRAARVRGALLALRPKYQTVVVLRYYAQMSFADIADVLACREDAVRARLSRAIKEMRQRLDADGSSGFSNS